MGGCVMCKKEVIIYTKIDKQGAFNTSPQFSTQFSKPIITTSSATLRTPKEKKKISIKFDGKSLISENNYFFQHYKIIKLIGEGGFGKIYKVIHNESGMIRAMKTIKKSYVAKQDDEKKFLKEIEILQQSNHPHIIKIYEYFIDSVNFYLIIEYMPCGDLLNAIEKTEVFNESMASTIMKQLLSAVSYMHSLNIVHRDIKPENILVSDFNPVSSTINIKLTDFGTSNYLLKDNSFLKKRVGSPYYIAPEILNKQYNEKCDLWSCGVLMYFLLIGDMPFNGSTPDKLKAKILEGNFDTSSLSFNKISKESQELIVKLLRKDFVKRISAEEALQDPWFAKNTSPLNKQVINNQNLTKVLDKIKTFKINDKLQLAGIAFIVHFIDTNNDISKLVAVFESLDSNGDGKLSFNELKNCMIQVKGQYWTEIEMAEIFQKLDQDKNGYIDYEEFLRVSIDVDSILSEKNLKLAFTNFDRNKDGKLNSDDIKTILGTENNEYCIDLINSIDNNEGEINFNQFADLMKKIMTNNSTKKSKNWRKAKTINNINDWDMFKFDNNQNFNRDSTKLTAKETTTTCKELIKMQYTRKLFEKEIHDEEEEK